MEEILKHLTHPDELYTRAQVLGRSSCVPKEPGFYGWYFRELPEGVPSAKCIVRDGATLLYVGIAPASSLSPRNLRSRLSGHLRGNASGSTLRLSLGCLLAGRLGLELRRTRSGKRVTFGPGERTLSEWLTGQALVTFCVVPAPWRFEHQVISAVSLPLNLEYNDGHEFHSVLSGLRSAAKKRAAALPCWPT